VATLDSTCKTSSIFSMDLTSSDLSTRGTTNFPLAISASSWALSKDSSSQLVKQLFQEAWEELGIAQGDVKVIPTEQFYRITKDIAKFPSFFNEPFYRRILDVWATCHHLNTTPEAVTMEMIELYWGMYMEPFDAIDRFFHLVKPVAGHGHIVRTDFSPFIQALLREHPGLEFLSSHGEFQEKYAVTVAARIFYYVDTHHTGRITSQQVRDSQLYEAFLQVDCEETISKTACYFSYEHFYVLCRRFWELDLDHDSRITRDDLLQYGGHALSSVIVNRIFDAAPRPSMYEASNHGVRNLDFMTYEDFVYFMLSEEDKNNEASLRYWFECVDLNSDGKLDIMEIRRFFSVQLHRISCMGHKIRPFVDVYCQIMGVINPVNPLYLTIDNFLSASKYKAGGALFDALFSLNKCMIRLEQQDSVSDLQNRFDEFQTDWDRFALMDYDRLGTEENSV
jgi:serine/threonine-protein phosphatase 2A regulatory subunit B''